MPASHARMHGLTIPNSSITMLAASFVVSCAMIASVKHVSHSNDVMTAHHWEVLHHHWPCTPSTKSSLHAQPVTKAGVPGQAAGMLMKVLETLTGRRRRCCCCCCCCCWQVLCLRALTGPGSCGQFVVVGGTTSCWAPLAGRMFRVLGLGLEMPSSWSCSRTRGFYQTLGSRWDCKARS